jgi:hypothetical protein
MGDREMVEKLAIIKDVKCGVMDRGVAMLAFTVYVSEGYAASQFLDWDAAKEMIEAYDVSHVDQLNGKPCWVEQGGGMILYKKPALI